ncbi:glucose-6-phosphate isomerase [Pseudosulfitobacter pseudonitzschiae]|uniref:glucose-6-phosphate isomerase n=1 Tax=Pseudosulfitobacter pseudonitzschiae TaxID=1402135 RepID=UPI001AF1FBF3|nr:glucose-6-phosphate isomerase [Pseudosulfitobacter pseudonitzschiae]MBM1817050.1 glucose-6-phosphate isomerase [Pseudosulfitobacter pseudonitzschiae]MBM1834053.1 glucose-6-phosphate isomerase [Pseudosulfitobacter pseudonitzschiae]MBM1838919.1 glucose-6-phosphate isomerase [Pseudosulfitobacter pseudonitzschiae]MBM1843768.1 glucose-6-phosphate isomerase [Pseudosulfitobacter pseudonitzschiae]MBM1848615.1 glucose-6-phosphate isomerase [Pseudosulfitobacter pseudonitzschiae]
MWTELKAKAAAVADRHMLELFEADPDRADRFSAQTGDMRLDYSKTNLDDDTRDQLLALADAAGWQAKRDAMFAGAAINQTEGRAVLHTALRNLDGGAVMVDGADVMPGVLDTLARMRAYADAVRGSDITDVINIGIGGSDLGPAMATQALAPYHDGPRVHFVSNVDGAHIADTLRGLDAKTTLVIVASKTFTTIETMTNARTARAWMQDHGGDPTQQFAALSTNMEKTADFGIPAERVFGFEDWVGGRYSMWGPIGLSVMIAVGPKAFDAFLRGGQAMDRHFCAAEGVENMPLMHALVGMWHRQVLGYATRAVLPYDQRLALLPAYFQQLEMESNGKSVTMDGKPVAVESGPVVWGAPGTNGQHAFYQLIHQGTDVIPCEFMIAAQGHEAELRHHHDLLVANCLAQSEALMRGRSLDEARAKVADKFTGDELERQAAHRVFPGNRPSVTLAYPLLDPETLGMIVALYEHRVFVEGVILGINSYDQWGVELGKELATALQPVVEGRESAEGKDGSTRGLVDFIHRHRN